MVNAKWRVLGNASEKLKKGGRACSGCKGRLCFDSHTGKAMYDI